jgi:hypothetical protein
VTAALPALGVPRGPDRRRPCGTNIRSTTVGAALWSQEVELDPARFVGPPPGPKRGRQVAAARPVRQGEIDQPSTCRSHRELQTSTPVPVIGPWLIPQGLQGRPLAQCGQLTELRSSSVICAPLCRRWPLPPVRRRGWRRRLPRDATGPQARSGNLAARWPRLFRRRRGR